jgi:predicted PurR-regulated permease PerM
MKTAEMLLHYMDELQKIVNYINTWLEKGTEFFLKAKAWVEKVIAWIEQAIDALVQSIGGRKTNFQLMSEDYLFV